MSTETRMARVLERRPRPAGRSTISIECPFCGCSTEARTWSLAGSGKRCECGALLTVPWRGGIYIATIEATR